MNRMPWSRIAIYRILVLAVFTGLLLGLASACAKKDASDTSPATALPILDLTCGGSTCIHSPS